MHEGAKPISFFQRMNLIMNGNWPDLLIGFMPSCSANDLFLFSNAKIFYSIIIRAYDYFIIGGISLAYVILVLSILFCKKKEWDAPMFSSTILIFVQTKNHCPDKVSIRKPIRCGLYRSDSRIRREITGGWFEIELLLFFFFFCKGAHISISS
jgi:hypothetical protein